MNKSRAGLLAIVLALPQCNAVCLGMGVGMSARMAGEYANRHAAEKREQTHNAAVLYASAQVEADHACNKRELLLSGVRDYQKRALCAKCDGGQTFIDDGKGGGIQTCSACGSGDVVTTLSDADQKQYCDLLTKIKKSEAESGLSESDDLTLAVMQAEESYDCNAGDQGACKSVASAQNAEQLSQMKEQTQAMQSQAAALRSQAAALQTANQQRWEASRGMPVLP